MATYRGGESGRKEKGKVHPCTRITPHITWTEKGHGWTTRRGKKKKKLKREWGMGQLDVLS